MAVVLVAVAVAVLAVLRPVLAVFQGFSDGLDLAPLASAAATSILIMAAALALVGLLAALADRRVELSPPAARRTRRGTALVAAVAIVAAATIGAVSLGDPVGAGSDALAEFTSGGDGGQPRGSSRFTSASGQNRFDFWEVGLSEFADAPVIGAGTGSFQTAYVREGETSQRPRFAHSLEVRLLFETGIVGALLFAGAVALALFAGARAVRRSSPLGAGAAGTAIVVFLYWVAHGSVDWFYELPALAAPAFAMLGLATAAAPRAERAGARPLAAGRARAAALAVAAVAMAAAIGAPWLAQRHTEAAIATWQVDAPGAFERLRSAATLNPLSSEPHGAAAAIALRLGNLEVARVEFEELLERDPGNAYAAVQLAALASERGERDEAVELLRRAAAIAPRDTLVEDALERIEVGERLDANAIYDAALERRSALTAGPPSQDGP
jgi:Flp pilus assembly protein TadD